MATYYFIGGEDCDFNIVGAWGVDAGAGRRRPSWSRHSLSLNSISTGSAANVTAEGLYADFPSALSTPFWATGHLFVSGTSTSCGGGYISFYDSSGIQRLSFCNDNANAPKWRLVKLDSAGTPTVLQTSASAIPLGSLNKIDVALSYGVSGSCQVYVGGVKVIDYSGDLTTNGVTQLAGIRYGNHTSNTTTIYTAWSECVVCDSDTRSINGIMTLVPSGAGNSSAWLGTYADVDEAAMGTDSISSATANQLSQFTVTLTSAISGGSALSAIAVNFRAHRGSLGPQNIQANVRTGGTDYNSASLSGFGLAMKPMQNIWTTNPNTGGTWLGSDLGAGFNVGVKSVA